MRTRNLDTIQYLTQEELKHLFAVIKDKRDRALFLIAYRHGLRASEVGLLQTEDVDLGAGRLRIRRLKRSLGGEHRMEPDEQRALKAWLKVRKKSDGPVFLSNRDRVISRRTLDYLMKAYCGAAGIARDKAHFHTLKHSIATHLLNAGSRVEVVQDWLGHANIENTMIYARLSSLTRDKEVSSAMARLPQF